MSGSCSECGESASLGEWHECRKGGSMSEKIVKVSRFGIIHYIALCENCDFCEADHVDRKNIRQRVRKHVIKTGHTVTIEAGSATHYSLQEKTEEQANEI